LDGVKDFDVTGAPAEVGSKMSCAFISGKCFAFLFYKCFGAYQDAGDTKAALQCSMCCKGVAIALKFYFIESFECGYVLAVDSF
jgi:Na+-driven multidrug efflux pump